jgi:hypothetical protein
MARLIVTEADLLDALATASTAPEDARTAQELATSHGVVLSRVQKALRALHVQGRLQCHHKQTVYMDGRRGRVPAYTILPAPKAKRRA